ncbi:MAG: hypothetical protein ABIS14_15050 [Sphingomonas sp.]
MRVDFAWPETKAELADLLESIMGWSPDGSVGDWDVDELENQPFKNVELEAWRERILREIWHLQLPSKDAHADRVAVDRAKKIIASLRQNQDA